jgi:DNA-binding HxlR family transcriptional regulator
MTGFGEFCPYAKAVEHLGDRWSLLIVKELAMHGTRGFNALADGMPGVSRSVLARRLRKLEELGLIARDPLVRSGVAPYRLAPAGEQLIPTLLSFDQWAHRWVPEDPALAQRDPDVIAFWLSNRVEPGQLPDRPVVVALDISGPRPKKHWLVLEHGAPPSICIEDPGLAPDRYVYVEADGMALYPVSRGLLSWSTAMAEGSVRLFGEPKLVAALPTWFRSSAPGRASTAGSMNGPAGAGPSPP